MDAGLFVEIGVVVGGGDGGGRRTSAGGETSVQDKLARKFAGRGVVTKTPAQTLGRSSSFFHVLLRPVTKPNLRSELTPTCTKKS